jgi:L-2-hydroxyglutarate oxidase LhgO
VGSSFSGPGYGPVAGSFIITDNKGHHALDHMIYKDT